MVPIDVPERNSLIWLGQGTVERQGGKEGNIMSIYG